MKFIFQMARREISSSWRRLIFFFLCIGIGVGSIVALRSTIQNVNRAVAGEARQLLTADVQVDSARPWQRETLVTIDATAKPPLVEARTETIEAATMLRPAAADREAAMMVELKGIEPPFPLVGDFKLANGELFRYELLANHGAIVAPALLDRLNLKVGDEVKIGTSTFQIRAVIEREPGAATGFRLGPRVFVQRAALEDAGLTGFGSRARRKILFTTADGGMETLVKRLRAELKNNLITVRSYKDSQENLSQLFARAENYLSLTGLVILVLGGIGVSNVTRVFIEQKQRTIAVLKCVGGTGRQITAAYLAQVIALGVAGSLLGVVLAKLTLLVVAWQFSESLPPDMSYDLRAGAIAQGLGLGVLISILFSALPLLRIRRIKPNVLLRDSSNGGSGGNRGSSSSSSGGRRGWPLQWLAQWRGQVDVWWWVTGAIVIGCLVLLSSWQVNSLRIGVLFLLSFAVTAGALYLAAMLITLLLRRTRHIGSFALRQAISSLYRPGNQTRVIMMAVGLGVFLVLAVQSVQSNLMREFDLGRREDLPNMFLIDVQKDQRDGIEEFIESATGVRPKMVPTIRARIARINDRTVDLEEGEGRRERGRLGREYVVTYRATLDPNERIVAGKFWDSSATTEPEVSIEESMRGLFGGLDVGSTITFDVLGRQVTTRVTNIRRVDWRNARTGFMVLFRPGTLEDAPQTLIGAINGPTSEPERSRFQAALVGRYPNISIIDVADVVRTIRRVLDNVTLAISFIGGFVFLSGGLILIGGIAMTKFQRIYENAILKTLGAKQRALLLILLIEYAVLGLVAGTIGSLAATLLSYVTAKYVFDIEWSFAPVINFAGIAATVVLVTVVGLISSYDVLTRKPLAILRAQ